MQKGEQGKSVKTVEWQFDYVQRGETLFHALPIRFSFDDLMEAADRLSIPGFEAVEHLRIRLREDLIHMDNIVFQQLRRKSSR